jgi:FkbM family methyltransferase
MRARAVWGAASSLLVVAVGAFGPWATTSGGTVDGSDDEVVGVVAVTAAVAVALLAVTRRRRLATITLLAGLVSAALIGQDLNDPAGPFGGPGRDIDPAWGMWVALAGSVGLAFASAVLLSNTGSRMRALRFAHALLPTSRRRELPRPRERARLGGTGGASGSSRKRTADPQRTRVNEFWSLARSLTPYVASESEAGVFVVPTRAHPKVFTRSTPKDTIVLGRAVDSLRRCGFVTERSAIVDVGAHIGTTSIAALTRHGFGRAVAIEPDPENLRLLRANIGLNGLHDRVTVVEGAVSDSAGTCQFLPGSREGVDAEFLWMKGRLVEEPVPGAISIETFTLDGLAEGGLIDPKTTGLLWLDCQKHDVKALQSATSFLEQRVPIVFVLRPHQLEEQTPLLDLLESMYECVVDLRRSPGIGWSAVFRPIDQLVSLPSRKTTLTDVLVC